MRFVPLITFVVCCCSLQAQNPEPVKLKSASIQWVADTPQLTYDVRYSGGDSTTMPTALKYLLKDIAECEGIYLTGEDKSKTIATQARRISLEYDGGKSKLKGIRISRIEVNESPSAVHCLVTFAKKPADEDLKRVDGVIDTFARKYKKAAKGVSSTVKHVETPKTAVWTFNVLFKDAAKKDKK